MNLTPKDLKQVPDLSDIPEDQLSWLIEHGEICTYPAGEHIFKTGDPIDRMFVILEGKARLMRQRNGNYSVFGQIGKNEITGFLPYSRATTAMGIGEAVEDTTCLVVSKSCIKKMATMHYELTAALVHTMTNRTREFTKQNVQAEKMMALGKLSAGLAHELNNPASAIERLAQELRRHVNNTPEKLKVVTTMNIAAAQIDSLTKAIDEMLKIPQCHLSLMQRTNLEDEMEEWLDEQDVQNSYDLAPALVDYCITTAHLEKVLEITGPENFPKAVEWLEHVITTEKMVIDMQDASERITSLVGSIKRYTHMDSAPEKQSSDLRSGIRNTLNMLAHKLKKKEIEVDEQYEEDLAMPKILVGDMNQVWTNLIDNAIDAMDNAGKLRISAENEKDCVVIRITDNGKGISEENLDSIFDPFFTTKSIGEGTGLGLDIVRRIVEQHSGTIHARSGNGETTFTVQLPIDDNE